MTIPTEQENPQGFHQRYQLQKLNGEPIDPSAEYFVLRLDSGGKDPNHIKACRTALRAYADAIEPFIPKLAADLHERISLHQLRDAGFNV